MNEKKEPTIKDIAKYAGVSVSTVSRVLNDRPSVSPIKKRAVTEAIQKFGFQPSMLARGMVSHQTRTLAVLVSDISNPYFTSMLAQIELIGKKADYSLFLFNTMTARNLPHEQIIETELQTFNTIEEKKVDGVLILGGEIDQEHPDTKYLTGLNALNKKIPVVIIGQKVADCDCVFVERQQFQSAAIATQHLLTLGYQKIGFLGGEPGIRITSDRLAGYQEMMTRYAQLDDDNIILNDFYIEDGYQGMNELIDRDGELPQALVVINDQVASGAFRSLVDHGLSCPEDIAIASCDAFSASEYTIPRITTIDHHNLDLSHVALDRLISLIQQKPASLINIPEPELIIRESCGSNLIHQTKQENS